MSKNIKAERCVSCGAIIPEGRLLCPNCESGTNKANDSEKILVFKCGRGYGKQLKIKRGEK